MKRNARTRFLTFINSARVLFWAIIPFILMVVVFFTCRAGFVHNANLNEDMQGSLYVSIRNQDTIQKDQLIVYYANNERHVTRVVSVLDDGALKVYDNNEGEYVTIAVEDVWGTPIILFGGDA